MNRGTKQPASDAIFCHKCQISFSVRPSLNVHNRKFHPNEAEVAMQQQRKQVCGMCSKRFRIISELHDHLHKDHDVSLNFQSENFYCDEDFINWKANVEKETTSKFILKGTRKNNAGVKFEYYICHRSGMCNFKVDRKRHVKSSGSIKCGSTCPAIINVTIQTVEGISEIKVQFQSVHIGHKQEVGKLTLTKDEKTKLALQLDMGVPKSSILDQTREQYSPTQRLGLTTRQDLQNICRDFSIQKKVVLHADDSASVDITVKKMLNSQDNPILVYKPVGEQLKDFPAIERHEFILGIMNETQRNLLEMYGSYGVMVDSTHGTYLYGFQLTTLMVHNSHHESFPVATLFSSRVAEATLLPFFMKIKEKLPNMKTKFIMSDDTTSFFNAWKKTFEDDSKHILCSKHVMKNLNWNVKSKVKYANKDKFKKELKLLVTEADVTTFEEMLNNFLWKYEKNETEFVKYFSETYCQRTEKWAYCYRIGMGISTDMKMERWHVQLKHGEAGDTVMKRLDKALNIVLNAVAKKLLSSIIFLEKGKLCQRIALIRARHNAGLELLENGSKIYELGNGQAIVSKTEESCIFSYTIEKNKDDCECNIRCDMCNICIHSMSCTCMDYSIRFVICRHIHFLQQSRVQGKSQPIALEVEIRNVDNDASLMVDMDEDKAQRDREEEEYRKETFSIMDRVVSRIKNFNCSPDNLKYIQESMKTLNSYLDWYEQGLI